MENRNKENEYYQNIYFIISFIKSKKIELFFSEQNDFINSLQKVKAIEAHINSNLIYEIAFYRFKINLKRIKKEEKKDKIIIILKDENNNSFESKINIHEIKTDKDIFLYNFEFEPIKKLLKLIFSPSRVILAPESFKLYIDYIKSENIPEKDREKKLSDLIYNTQKILFEKKENHLLYFYANIFVECYKYKTLCLNHIQLFNKDMFNINEVVYDKYPEVKNIIKSLINDINPIFKYVDKSNKEKIIKQKMINFLFYYNYFYQRKEINKMLINNDIKEYCFNILLENEKYLKDLKLNKNSMTILLKLCKDFEQINIIFLYNDDFLDLLEIINGNIEYIFQLYNDIDEKIKSKKIIRFKHFVKPKKTDNIEEIFNKIKILLTHEFKKNIFIFKISSSTLNKYLEIYSESNLKELIILYNISKYLKRNDQLSEITNLNKISNILHNKGLYFLEQHKLNNYEILLYLENDDYYINSSNQKVFFNVLNNFDMNNINSDFLVKWRKVEWDKRYKNNKLLFYENISNTIDDMKNFGNLFELFDINENQKNYDIESLETMQKTYIRLFNDKIKKNEQFITQTVDLIYYCEIKNINPEPMIYKGLYKNKRNNIDIIDDIYKKLILKKEKFSEKITDITVNFFNENILNLNSSSLDFLLKNIKTKNLNSDIILFLNDYILVKDDIFSINETDNFKIYKILKSNNYLEEELLGHSPYYISNLSLIFNITSSLDNLDIEYNYINKFYVEKKENILYEKLLLIVNNDNIKISKYKENIDKCINNINILLKDFEYILNFLKFYFPETQHENIEKIEKIINNIQNKNINYYKSNYDFYLTLKNKYFKDAEEHNKLKNNNLILDIYNNLKKTFNNEIQNFSKIQQFIEIMKTILEENTCKSQKINYKKLEKFLCLIKMPKEEFSKGIYLMVKIFNINNEINIDKIIEEIFYLNKKPKLINFVEILINLIESLGVKQTYYYSFLKIMHKYMTRSKEPSVIKLSESIIEKYGFEIDENNNKFENFLKNLNEKKEEREFLFDKKNHSEIFLKRLKNINNESNHIFDGFDKVFLFISKYMQYKEAKTDKEIINDMKNDINNNEHLESCFKNYFNKCKLLKEFF